MALAQVLEQDKAEELDIEQEPGQDTVLAVVQVPKNKNILIESSSI